MGLHLSLSVVLWSALGTVVPVLNRGRSRGAAPPPGVPGRFFSGGYFAAGFFSSQYFR